MQGEYLRLGNCLGNSKLDEISGFDRGDHRSNCLCVRTDAMPVVAGEFQDGYFPSSQILLIAEILIRSNEEIKLPFGQFEKLSILDSRPSLFVGMGTCVSLQQSAQRPRNALIE